MPPAETQSRPPQPPPQALQPVIYLLVANLGMSILLTILVFIFKSSVVNFQVDHLHIRQSSTMTAQDQIDLARTTAQIGIWSRVGGNIVVAVAYAFLVRALLRGKRRAYRRVIILSAAGIVSLAFLWLTPYPTWIRIEQILQAFLLAAILYRATRPEVRAYFPKPPKKPQSRRRVGRRS
jgi:hypothetical protein